VELLFGKIILKQVKHDEVQRIAITRSLAINNPKIVIADSHRRAYSAIGKEIIELLYSY
jgi:predicted ABC-type transport system involved in lysophospholipase L1 biosynthesis ATPase subunit